MDPRNWFLEMCRLALLQMAPANFGHNVDRLHAAAYRGAETHPNLPLKSNSELVWRRGNEGRSPKRLRSPDKRSRALRAGRALGPGA